MAVFVARANMCEKRVSRHLISYSINMVNLGYHMHIMFKPGVLIRSSFEVVSDVTYIHTYIVTESLLYTIKKIDIGTESLR
jgi:hypothetical protein